MIEVYFSDKSRTTRTSMDVCYRRVVMSFADEIDSKYPGRLLLRHTNDQTPFSYSESYDLTSPYKRRAYISAAVLRA